jgi:hypothetical protein
MYLVKVVEQVLRVLNLSTDEGRNVFISSIANQKRMVEFSMSIAAAPLRTRSYPGLISARVWTKIVASAAKEGLFWRIVSCPSFSRSGDGESAPIIYHTTGTGENVIHEILQHTSRTSRASFLESTAARRTPNGRPLANVELSCPHSHRQAEISKTLLGYQDNSSHGG